MGGGGDNNTQGEKKELLIENKVYDVTNFKHPGGSVINFYAGKGIDASDAFWQFHIRSPKVEKYLRNLPTRDATKDELTKNLLPKQQELLEDFRAFSKQLEAEGFFKPSPVHTIYRLSEILIMHAIGFYCLFHNMIPVGLLILGLVSGRCGWLMHEGGHYSMTGNVFMDKLFQECLYGVGCGMSGHWWRVNHNKHHSTPQKIGFDVDLNTLPLVAFSEKMVKKAGFSQKVWIRLQSFLFPVITTLLVALGWQFFLHPKHVLRTRNWSEMFFMSLRYVLIGTFIVPHFGLGQTLLLYLAYNWIAANYIFINFAVSHTHLPTVSREDTQVDWIRYASIHTMNVHPGPLRFINWWMSYLNFQIEHHLFPCMPQFRHPTISPRVKAFFEKHGLKYDQRSYTQAMAVTFQNLHKVGIDVFYG